MMSRTWYWASVSTWNLLTPGSGFKAIAASIDGTQTTRYVDQLGELKRAQSSHNDCSFRLHHRADRHAGRATKINIILGKVATEGKFVLPTPLDIRPPLWSFETSDLLSSLELCLLSISSTSLTTL